MPGSETLRTVGLALALGCFTAAAAATPPPAAGAARLVAQWEREVRRQGVDPATLANPIAVTPEMQRLAVQVAGLREPLEQLRRLQGYLFDEGQFPFDYEARGTFTAEEAFTLRRGNCVSFTNLFIGLGRSLGIPLKAALIRRGESEVDGSLVVVNNHMVALYQHSDGVTVYDFSRNRGELVTSMWIMNDAWITAVFLNNKGVDELRGGRPEDAIRFLETAVQLAPDFTGAYGNLGVAYRQAGDTDRALETYQRALAFEARDPSVLNNLASLLEALGRRDEARDALKAANLKNATPFLLLTRGDLEMSQGHLDEAERLFRRARRLDPRIPEVYLALARLEVRRGRNGAAQRLVEKALGLDPAHPEALQMAAKLRPSPPPR